MGTIKQPLAAKLLARRELHRERLAMDLERTRSFPLNVGYNDYSRGRPGWANSVLVNSSGDPSDHVFGGYAGSSKDTPLLAQVPYIAELLTTTFNRDHLLWARLFICEDGMLIPHRDYLDLPEDEFTRIHLALELGPESMHSEGAQVFRMRAGEVWFIDGTVSHGAASYDGAPRTYLSCDFPSGVPFDDLIAGDAIAAAAGAKPDFVERPALPDTFHRELQTAVGLIDRYGVDEFIGIVSRYPYRYDADCGAVYDWVIEAAKANGQSDVVEHATERRKFFLGI